MARPRHGKLPRAGPRRDDAYRDLNPQAIARAWDLAIEIDTIHRQARGDQPTMPVIAPSPVRWSADALALFAEYRDMRAVHAPPECNAGDACWVRDGPPSIANHGAGASRCLGCGGAPKPPLVVERRRRPAKC